MKYFVYEDNMKDEAFIENLKFKLSSVEFISAQTPDGGWNSLPEKIYKFWKSYFLLSWNALRRTKRGDTIITWQVFIGVMTGLLIRIFRLKRDLIVLSFIYRPRSNKIVGRARYAITRFGLAAAGKIVCYSTYEETHYTGLFRLKSGRFYFAQLGKTYDAHPAQGRGGSGYIFSAGQSNRDFDALIKSVDEIDVRLLIASTNKITIPEKLMNKVAVERLNGREFQDALSNSLLTVIPLTDSEYSSGQIVLINAMAAGKCVIITETTWSKDYICHGENAWLVPPGDPDALADAIQTLMRDDELRKKIELNARKTYEEQLNGREFSNRIATIIGE